MFLFQILESQFGIKRCLSKRETVCSLVEEDQREAYAISLLDLFCHVDDRKPVPILVQRVWGKLFGDKGYLSQPLTQPLRQRGITLITKLKSNMKSRLILMVDKLLLRKRSILETITDQLKNIS